MGHAASVLNHQAALQVINQDREHPISCLAVLGEPLLEEGVGVGGLQHRDLHDVGIIRADASDDLAITAHLLRHTITVWVDGDKRVIGIARDDVIAQAIVTSFGL